MREKIRFGILDEPYLPQRGAHAVQICNPSGIGGETCEQHCDVTFHRSEAVLPTGLEEIQEVYAIRLRCVLVRVVRVITMSCQKHNIETNTGLPHVRKSRITDCGTNRSLCSGCSVVVSEPCVRAVCAVILNGDIHNSHRTGAKALFFVFCPIVVNIEDLTYGVNRVRRHWSGNRNGLAFQGRYGRQERNQENRGFKVVHGDWWKKKYNCLRIVLVFGVDVSGQCWETLLSGPSISTFFNTKTIVEPLRHMEQECLFFIIAQFYWLGCILFPKSGRLHQHISRLVGRSFLGAGRSHFDIKVYPMGFLYRFFLKFWIYFTLWALRFLNLRRPRQLFYLKLWTRMVCMKSAIYHVWPISCMVHVCRGMQDVLP